MNGTRAFVLLCACAGFPAWADNCAKFHAFAAGDAAFELYGATAICTTSRQLGGGQSRDCHWPFDYRAQAAQVAFSELVDGLTQCTDGPVIRDTGSVNHPDSFEQLTTTINGRSFSLSIKDKGARQETLIFLRVMGE